jgi:hypothetical protein
MHSPWMIKRILEWKPVGRLRLGGSRIRWLDDGSSDLKVTNVNNWKGLFLNKNAGNDLVEKAKTHNKGCKVNGRGRRRRSP